MKKYIYLIFILNSFIFANDIENNKTIKKQYIKQTNKNFEKNSTIDIIDNNISIDKELKEKQEQWRHCLKKARTKQEAYDCKNFIEKKENFIDKIINFLKGLFS